MRYLSGIEQFIHLCWILQPQRDLPNSVAVAEQVL
jgi:hypothetical protein